MASDATPEGMPMAATAIVTCTALPEADRDETLLLDTLAAAGVPAELVAWDDPDADWGSFGLAVIRSTWNYVTDLPAFLSWARRAAEVTTLVNPVDVVAWNTHKGYLRELADRGVPVVPTVHVDQGSDVGLAELLGERGWTDVVVKPAVGAGSTLTERITDPVTVESVAFWRRLVRDRDALVQPYLASVAQYGERSLIWIDGEFTHAVRKAPRLSGDDEAVSDALPIAADELALAEQVIADVDHDLLYARVDLIRDDHGRPLLAELELVEPSLFLTQHRPALDRLVAAVKRLSS